MYLFIFGCTGSLSVHPSFSCGWWGLLSGCGASVLSVLACLAVEHGLWSTDSVVVLQGLSCPVACGILPDQESNMCPLH